MPLPLLLPSLVQEETNFVFLVMEVSGRRLVAGGGVS